MKRRVTSAMVLEAAERLAQPVVKVEDLALELNICPQELSSHIRILETFGKLRLTHTKHGLNISLPSNS